MLNRENAVLVIVDVQGRLATLMHEKERFFDNLVRLIRGAQVLGIPIIWNEQLPDKLGDTIQQIREVLTGQSPLIKNTFSCCGNLGFSERLAILKRKQILLAGMETHVCVYQTAADLLHQDYDVYVVADAVSSRSLENKTIGIKAMMRSGARVTSVEMALFEMLRTAEGDEFKQVINVVK